MTQSELRVRVGSMTKTEMVSLRDQIETNWSDSLRPLMNILSLGCISKFKTTLARL